MTKEEAYDFIRERAEYTQNGTMVNIVTVEEVVNMVSFNDELFEKAIEGIYNCPGNSLDGMQLGDALYYIDVALGIED